MLRAIFAAYRAAFAGLPLQCWILALATFINRSGTMVLPFLVLYLTHQKGFSPKEAGQFLSVFGVGSILGSMLGGRLSDLVSPKWIQVGALLSGGVSLIVLGQQQEPIAIAVALMATALLLDSFRPANLTALSAVCPPEHRKRAFALSRLSANLGMMIGPALGGLLAVRSYSLLFIVDGVTCVVSGLLLAGLLRLPERRARAAKTRGESPLRDRRFLAFLSAIFFLGLIFFQLESTYVLYLREFYGMKENLIGLVFIVNTVLIVSLEMLITQRLIAVPPLRAMAVGAVLIGAGFGLLPVGTLLGASVGFVIFTVVVWTLGESVALPQMAAFVSELANEENRGRYMGLYSLTFGIGFAISPSVGTMLYQGLGPSWVFACCGAGGLIVCAALLRLDRAIGSGTARGLADRR